MPISQKPKDVLHILDVPNKIFTILSILFQTTTNEMLLKSQNKHVEIMLKLVRIYKYEQHILYVKLVLGTSFVRGHNLTGEIQLYPYRLK